MTDMKSTPVSQVIGEPRGCTLHRGLWNEPTCYSLLGTGDDFVYNQYNNLCFEYNRYRTKYLLLITCILVKYGEFDCYGELLDETWFIARKLRFMQIHVLSHNLI